MEIKVGCCGFPVNKREYFKNFKIVEIQSTFYQPPMKIETVRKWKKEAPEDFIFSLKAWQIITHPFSSPTYRKLEEKIGNFKNYGSFKNKKEIFLAWERTKEIAKVLSAKIIVFQSPQSFKPEKKNIENFRNFFKKIKNRKFIFAWEPRGKWPKDLIKKLCKELNLVHCTDPFKQNPVFGRINYFRLHGLPGYNLRYKYTKKDLEKLLNFCDKKENYILFNNLSMFQDSIKFQKIIKVRQISRS
jgi:uncharacterized protein YecE (DUF72 family)